MSQLSSEKAPRQLRDVERLVGTVVKHGVGEGIHPSKDMVESHDSGYQA